MNVFTGELQERVDVAMSHGRIAYIGSADHTIGEGTQVIEANGRFISPGLLDGHMHVESTMLTVTEFAKAAIVTGTTGVYMDPMRSPTYSAWRACAGCTRKGSSCR